jgi:hypothetical protein
VARILLTGHSDDEAMVRAEPVAHRLLAKPCPAGCLYDTVSRTSASVARVHGKETVARVAARCTIPARPSPEALEALPVDGRLAELAGWLGPYAHGYLALATLLLAPDELEQAKGAVRIAHALGRGTRHHDLVCAGALLANVGQALLGGAQGRAVDPAVERRELGISHAEVSARVLDVWGAPLSMVEAVGVHHTPDEIPRSHAPAAAIVCVATEIAEGREPPVELVEAYSLSQAVHALDAGRAPT